MNIILVRAPSIISRLSSLTLGLILILGTSWVAHGSEFFCPSGNVTCLIATINSANAIRGKHTIHLEPGIYTLQVVHNTTEGRNGLPSITRSIRIQATADDPPTVIERDPAATFFRILHVSAGGELTLNGLTVQRSDAGLAQGGAIFNRGVTSLQDSIVT